MAKIKKLTQDQNPTSDTRLNIRPETKKDFSKITQVNDSAFGQKNEGRLIERLRQTENYIPELSLVAELDDEIIGHILLYPITIHSDISLFQSISLGPMAVTPAHQRTGIGSRLVIEGLEAAKKLGHRSVIVVGHPEYYPKFGFKRASHWNIKVPFEVPNDAFLALELVEGELEGKRGTVEYPEEFNEAM